MRVAAVIGVIFALLSLPVVCLWGLVGVGFLYWDLYSDNMFKWDEFGDMLMGMFFGLMALFLGAVCIYLAVLMAVDFVPIPFTIGGGVSFVLSVLSFWRAKTLEP